MFTQPAYIVTLQAAALAPPHPNTSHCCSAQNSGSSGNKISACTTSRNRMSRSADQKVRTMSAAIAYYDNNTGVKLSTGLTASMPRFTRYTSLVTCHTPDAKWGHFRATMMQSLAATAGTQ